MSNWFFEFRQGWGSGISLLREYGSHAVCRSVRLKVEFLLEIWLSQDWGATHNGVDLIERVLFFFSPVEGC